MDKTSWTYSRQKPLENISIKYTEQGGYRNVLDIFKQNQNGR